jgi:hypothetical protein
MEQSNLTQRELLLEQQAQSKSELDLRLIAMRFVPGSSQTDVELTLRVSNAGLGTTTIVRAFVQELTEQGALTTALSKFLSQVESNATQAVGLVFAPTGTAVMDLPNVAEVRGRGSADMTIVLRLGAFAGNREELHRLTRDRRAFAVLRLVDVRGQIAALTLWRCRELLPWKPAPTHSASPTSDFSAINFATCEGGVFHADVPTR